MLAALVVAAAIPACTPLELVPLGGSLQGATGSMLGEFAIKSVSRRRCLVGGRPRAALIGPDTRPLKTKERALPATVGPPRVVVSVSPGTTVYVRVQWSNWCGAWPAGVQRRTLALRLTLTTGISVSAALKTGRPICAEKARPSTLALSTFGLRG